MIYIRNNSEELNVKEMPKYYFWLLNSMSDQEEMNCNSFFKFIFSVTLFCFISIKPTFRLKKIFQPKECMAFVFIQQKILFFPVFNK